MKTVTKEIVMTEKDEQHYKKNIICRACEKETISDNIRDHCHLTGKYRGPAYNKQFLNVTQKRSNFIPFVFHNYSFYDCHVFF